MTSHLAYLAAPARQGGKTLGARADPWLIAAILDMLTLYLWIFLSHIDTLLNMVNWPLICAISILVKLTFKFIYFANYHCWNNTFKENQNFVSLTKITVVHINEKKKEDFSDQFVRHEELLGVIYHFLINPESIAIFSIRTSRKKDDSLKKLLTW